MRESILMALKEGRNVSGARLSRSLGVSRTAVWKHICWLRRLGYPIDSSPRRGYRLLDPKGVLLPSEIQDRAPHPWKVVFLWEADSTQDVARGLASRGAEEPTAVVAERQTRGRGRLGRAWASPHGGIYMSAIVRPRMSPSETPRLPLMAGVCVADAIREVCGLSPSLKWPNDVLLDGKKVAGILCEMDCETDRVNWVILGIGVNVNSDVPLELRSTATSLKERCGGRISRIELLIKVLDTLWRTYNDVHREGFEGVLNRWRELSSTLGRRVTVCDGREVHEGMAVDIDEHGALLLQGADGYRRRVLAGDVTLGTSV